uniref:Mitotic checkpoint protein BUB3 n=1 Tax=Pinguiococcus pyrenoidosus TaxID=172671 RepID=A0A7R9UC44_9STRA
MPRTRLSSPPEDGITCVNFAPTSNALLVSSWDSSLRIYDADLDLVRGRFSAGAPALCCAFLDDSKALCGGLDGKLRLFDVATSSALELGSHDAAVRALGCNEDLKLVVTGSWDRTVKTWDTRSGTNGVAAASVEMPGKVYSLSVRESVVVAASASQAVWVFDLRNMSEPVARRQSSLKYQTRCIALSPDAMSFALGSIEGRVAVEYVSDDPAMQGKKYSFKCHRSGDVIFPVNAVAFHPLFGTFATGGCDGGVSIWDGANKRRIIGLKNFPTSIASLAFNQDGTLLAIASSYTFEQGEIEHPPDEIYVHKLLPTEVKPKQRLARKSSAG